MPQNSQQHPLRILQYNYRFCIEGGVENVLRNWYNYIDKDKFFIDFAILSGSGLDTNFQNKVRQDGHIFLVGSEQNEQNLFARIPFYFRLFRLLRAGKYDLFHAHESTPFICWHCFIAKLAGVRKIYMIAHAAAAANLPPIMRKIRSCILRWITDRRLAVSQKAGLALYGDKLPFTVLHNGINARKFAFDPQTRQQFRKQLNLENNFVLGFVGRLDKGKNVSFILDIFQQIYQKNPAARLVLVGVGHVQNQLSDKVKNLKLQQQVIFTGLQSNTALYYQAFDAFLLPSQDEGLPIVHLEAQASGLPCFISDAFTQESTVCNTTIISLSKSAKQWADIILEKTRTFQRKDDSLLLKQAGFDIQSRVKKLEQVYTDL